MDFYTHCNNVHVVTGYKVIYISAPVSFSQVKVPGEYVAYKVSLKCGSLEFVSTLKPEVSQEMMVSVQPTQVNADISLTPTIGGRLLTERERMGV